MMTFTTAKADLQSRRVVASASGRVDFTGGFTDVEPYCSRFGAVHINAAIDLGTKIQLQPRVDNVVQINSVVTNLSLRWDASEAPPPSARMFGTIINDLAPNVGMDVLVDASVPVGVGLGSSGSMTVALVAALCSLRNSNMSLGDIAELAISGERKAGIVGGRQDQYAAAYGGVNQFRFGAGQSSVVRLGTTDGETSWLNGRILIAHSHGRRESTDIVESIFDAYRDGDSRVTSALNRLNSISADVRSAFICRDLDSLIACTHEIRAAQEQLHPRICDPEFRPLLTALSQSGFAAAKYLGAGGRGGCLMIITPEEKLVIVEKILRDRKLNVLHPSIATCTLKAYQSH